MDEPPFDAETALQQAVGDVPLLEATSREYLGRWNRLISTTNWEKGRIICEWRQALIEAEAPAGSYSDETWSRRVGNVSPQHVGRLRRVYQRFGASYEQYAGLYWSHFQAALDWPDAEMWLEGAVQSSWSVAQMRNQRWQALGAPPALKPRDEDVLTAELDEDADPAHQGPMPESISGSLGVVQDAEPPGHETSASIDNVDDAAESGEADSWADPLADQATTEPFRPFENLPPLPPDLNEPFEAFKLGILHHKLSGWQEVSCQDVLAVLESLKQLALAPAGD